MNINDIFSEFIKECDNIDRLKAKKVEDFSRTIKSDLDDLLGQEDFSRTEFDYLVNLKSVLQEKENEMDTQIRNEKEKLKVLTLDKVSEYLNSYLDSATSVNLTESVVENSVNYAVEVFSKNKEEEKVVEEPVIESFKDESVQDNIEKVLNTTQQQPVEPVQVIESVKPIQEETPQVKPVNSTESKDALESVQKELDNLLKAQQNRQQQVVQEQPKEEEKEVSTVELEKMLQDFKDLI